MGKKEPRRLVDGLGERGMYVMLIDLLRRGDDELRTPLPNSM